MATGLAEKQFTSGLQDLLASFGSKGSTTQTTSANTGPLQSVIASAQQPMNMELYNALIANIMQTAAQQVPQLSDALANATGSRTSSNSPLALAIAQLQSQAANAGASKVIDFNQNQQQIAANAAGQLAQATRVTNQQSTAGKPAVNPLATMLLGTVANQFDKRGGFDKLFGRDKAGAVNASVATPASAFAAPALSAAAPTTVFEPSVFGPPAPSFTPTAEFASPTGADLLGDFISSGFSSFVPDTAGSEFLGDLLGGGFSSELDLGGADLSWSPDEWWFADGGVIRNKNQMGAPIQRQGTLAVSPEMLTRTQAPATGASSGAAVSSDALYTMLQRAVQQAQQGVGSEQEGRNPADNPGGAINMAAGNPGGQAVGRSMAGLGINFGLGATGLASNPLSSMAAKQGLQTMGIPANGIIGLLAAIAQATAAQTDATGAINAAKDPLGAMLVALEVASPGKVGNVSGISGDTDTAVSAANALSSVTGQDPLSALMDVTGAFGTAPGTAQNSDTSTSGGAVGQADAGGMLGGLASGDIGFSDGGMIKGPGTGTSDSIPAKNRIPGGKPARFSDGEFIFPADSVKILGEDLLTRLLQSTHTPVRR